MPDVFGIWYMLEFKKGAYTMYYGTPNTPLNPTFYIFCSRFDSKRNIVVNSPKIVKMKNRNSLLSIPVRFYGQIK